MKYKLLIIGTIALIFGCTTPPIMPPGFTGEEANGDCVPGFISFQHEILPLVTSTTPFLSFNKNKSKIKRNDLFRSLILKNFIRLPSF